MARDDETFSDGMLTGKAARHGTWQWKCISDVIGVKHVAQQWYRISNRTLSETQLDMGKAIGRYCSSSLDRRSVGVFGVTIEIEC